MAQVLLAALVIGSVGVTVAADAPVVEDESATLVAVPYVTNRRPETPDAEPMTYGGGRGTPSVGRCGVAFRPIPVISQIAPRVRFYLADETRRIGIERQVDQEAFWRRLARDVAQTATGSVVVFVHGYNYGFERQCRAAAELQRTLAGRAVVLMFSWPSNGRPTDYIPDQADVEWSVPFLADVLAGLGDRLGPQRVQVLVHSLGTRGLVLALDRLRAQRKASPLIGPLVLMAPDFDAETFVDRLPDLLPLTTGITLYASSNDTPLKASHRLHESSRLGEGGELLTVVEGMQSVDVSPLGRYQVFGHEYFLFHPTVVVDLAQLLGEGRGAAERPGLRSVSDGDLVFWELVGDPPLGDVLDD